MGILKRLRRRLSGSSNRTDDGDPAYRCVRCGRGFERRHHSCPDCNAQFVAPVDDE